MTPLRAWLLWLAGFLFFPLAGVLSGLLLQQILPVHAAVSEVPA